MFIKMKSRETANALASMGFAYTVEKINGETFYCFEHTPEIAAKILDKFADERVVVDDCLRF